MIIRDETELCVKDLMNQEFLHLSPGCKMDSVLHTMIEHDVGHAVVVDSLNPKIMIGFVTKADVLKAYELSIFRLQQQGYDIDEISPADVIDVEKAVSEK